MLPGVLQSSALLCFWSFFRSKHGDNP